MKTILITILQAVEAKNILRTQIVKTLLKDPNIRIICITRSKERVLYYQKEIPHERIIYNAMYDVPVGGLEKIFSFLKFHLIRTATTDLRKKMHLIDSGNYFTFFSTTLLNRLIARKSIRQILRFFDYHFIGSTGFGMVLDTYKPDVVFLALFKCHR